jgi:hypothetical protein
MNSNITVEKEKLIFDTISSFQIMTPEFIEKYDKIYNGINNILEKINKEYNKTKKNQNDKTDKIDDLELTKYKPRTQENLVNNITRLTENLSKGLKN